MLAFAAAALRVILVALIDQRNKVLALTLTLTPTPTLSNPNPNPSPNPNPNPDRHPNPNSTPNPNKVLAQSLRAAAEVAQPGAAVVGVIGMAHVNGVRRLLASTKPPAR